MSDGPVFVEKVDVEAMASYIAARWISEGDEEIWHNDLSEDDRNAWRRVASEAIDAALVGVRPAKGLEDLEALIDERIKRALSEAVVVGDKLWDGS